MSGIMTGDHIAISKHAAERFRVFCKASIDHHPNAAFAMLVWACHHSEWEPLAIGDWALHPDGPDMDDVTLRLRRRSRKSDDGGRVWIVITVLPASNKTKA